MSTDRTLSQGAAAQATLRVRVANKQTLATDICSFDLEASDGAQLPAFEAGAHVDVYLPNGLLRSYSLCNDPGVAGAYRIAVLREAASRGGSAYMHSAVQTGSELTISTPKNLFALAPTARRSVLLAGGIGLTPLLAMAYTLAARASDFTLHHCCRSADRAALRDTLQQAPWAAQVHWHFDDGAPEQKLDLQHVLAQPAEDTHLYVCGPQGFMDAVLAQARALGWSADCLHKEYFSAAPVARSDDGSFEIELASSGQVLRVAPQQTVVQALAAAGVDIATSCEQGVCGTCLTRVLQGTPEHRDVYLTPEERAANDQFTPCCSRALSARLLLDL